MTLFFFARRIDDTAHVGAAIRTDNMGRNRGAAFRANRQISRLQPIVGTSGPGPRVALFSFGYCHLSACQPLGNEFRQPDFSGLEKVR